jgi:predicted nucleotidyltransferase
MVVGAHAMAFHGVTRSTGDIDLWIKCDAVNSDKVYRALADFGASLNDLDKKDLEKPGNVFQIGVAPNRIDILTSIDGVVFDEAYEGRGIVEIVGIKIPVISKHHLIENKITVGRPQDLVDIQLLKENSK